MLKDWKKKFFLMIPICFLDFDLCPSRKAMKSMNSGRRPLLNARTIRGAKNV
jgi:hypothetical protein